MRVVPLLLSAIVAVALVAGCGGSQSAQTDSTPPPAASETTPVVTPEPAPPPAVEHVYYVVFWRGIHVLTIYQGEGSVRSEEPDNPSTVLPTRCEYMSAISHYYEHEADIAVLIERADNLEDFLEV